MALAVLLSWLATRTARKAGHARVEPPARALETGWSWKDIPLTPYLGTRHLVRAMKQHPLVRYRYVLAFKECSLATFLARSGMREANRLAVAARMNPQERARWYDACEGGWRVSFRVAVAAADEAALASSTAAMGAAIEGNFHGFAFEAPRRHRDGHRRDHRDHRRCREAYMLGEEITPEAAVPKELAPDVPSSIAVEAHAPAAMRSDVAIGKVIEPETLDATCEAGIRFAHLEGGLVVAGGRVAERVALLKIILSKQSPFVPVIIDDHGDYHVPGAAILAPGRGCTVNPLVPATRQHAALVVTALSAIHAFTQEQEAFLATRLQEFIDAAAAKNELPLPAGLVALLASDAKSGAEKAVALALQRDLAGWAAGHVGVGDTPAIEALASSGKPVVVDLSGVQGAEKRVLKAMLLLKMISLGARKAPKPLLAVVPDFDKVFHDERSDRLPPRVARAAGQVANALAGAVPRFVITAQDPVKLPQQLLAHASTVVAFRQPSPQARDVMTPALGLEDEQLYDKSRHASYQHEYLAKLPPGTCFLRRPDVSSPFLVAIDVAGAAKLLPRRVALDDTESQPAGDPLDSALSQFGLVKGDIVALLDAMRKSGNQGVKKDWMADILAQKCQATIARRDPALPAKDAGAQARAMAARVLDVLVGRGILAEDGFNPSGLKKGVTARMTQYGETALARSAPAGDVAVMDPLRERVLEAEQAIADEYPGGDVKALGERLLSDMVALFQALHDRGELDRHANLLARCNEHAAALNKTMDDGNDLSTRLLIAPVIDDFRLVSSLSDLD
ncbi:MAG: hypothetical protein Q6365_019520 [Candidatus Sigynarchaeota archaeon]